MANGSRDASSFPAEALEKIKITDPVSVEKMRDLIHDLRARLADLEIENGKLRASGKESERLQRECAAVYEHSPAGYALLDPEGTIRGINDTGANLLGGTREDLVGQSLSRSVLRKDRPTLREHLMMTRSGERARTIELRLPERDGEPRAILISSLFAEDGIRTAIIDISERKRTEDEAAGEQARANEENSRILTTVLEYIPEGIMLFDAPGNHIRATSHYLETILGFPGKDIEGFSIKEYFERTQPQHPDGTNPSGPEEIPIFRAIHNGEIVVNEEWVITRPDGSPVTVIINAGPIRDAAGAIIGGISAWRDITDRKRIEMALRESEERYRTLSGIISDYAFSFRVEPGPVIANEWMTEGFSRITGYTVQELESQGGINSITYPEDASVVSGTLQKLLSGETDIQMEYRAIAKNSEIRWLNVYAHSVWDVDENRVIQFYGVAQNITDRKRIEENLRESEERYRRIVETAEEGVWMIDSEDNTSYANGKFAGMLGYTVEEIVGRPAYDLADPEFIPLLKQNLQLRRAGHRGQYEFTFRHKNGSGLWAMVSATPMFDPKGNYVGSFAMVTDITDRKRAEEKLRESEERYRRIVETAEEGIIVLNTENQVTYSNDKFADMLGYAEEEMVGKPIFDLAAPEFIPVLEENLRLRRDGHRGQYEFKFLRKDGSGMWAMTSATPILDHTGEYSGSFDMITDITDRKQVEEALKAARDELEERVWRRTVELEQAVEKLRAQIAERERAEAEKRHAESMAEKRQREFETLVETAPDVIARFNRNFKLVYINRAIENETGIPVADFFAQPLRELPIPGDLSHRWMEKIRAVLETAQEETIETKLDFPSGRKWYFSRLAPVLAPDGMVDSVLSISHNITELKSAEEELQKHREHLEELVEERTGELERSNEQLRQEIAERKRVEEQITQLNENLRRQTAQLLASNKELEAFSYSVSHDLRAPLRSIDGFSLALLEDYADRFDNTGRDYLQRIRISTQRMGQLIDDILNLSRVARTEMQHLTVDLSGMAREIVAELRKTHPDHTVEETIQDNVTTRGDPVLLRLVLENLLGNAWKFTTHTPQARIEFGETIIDDQPTYFVRDNGAGFDMRYANKLFLPFQRLHTKEEFSGTGIGLAIVRRIIQRHGGRVWAEGELGKGAIFYFTL